MAHSVKFWDKQSLRYDDISDKYDPSYKRIIEKSAPYLDSETMVLDFACGTGRISIEIASKVKNLIALDTSKGMLERAGEKAKQKNIQNISFLHSDIYDVSLREEGFELVFALNILHLLKDKESVIRRIHHLLKPGGIFISSTACMAGAMKPGNLLIKFLSRMRVLPYMTILDSPEFRNVITKENFEILYTEELDYNPPNYFVIARKQK